MLLSSHFSAAVASLRSIVLRNSATSFSNLRRSSLVSDLGLADRDDADEDFSVLVGATCRIRALKQANPGIAD